MGTRQQWSVMVAGAATIWLVVVLWFSLANYTRGLDFLVIGIALMMQLSVLMAWDLFPRLPLWIVAGHGLIMVSLALGFVITAPPGAPPPGTIALAVPWLVIGLVPAGLAMLVASGIRWTRADSLVH